MRLWPKVRRVAGCSVHALAITVLSGGEQLLIATEERVALGGGQARVPAGAGLLPGRAACQVSRRTLAFMGSTAESNDRESVS
jgi:hypothetical protein